MAISLIEAQAASEISSLLYDFLPGSPHPYADKTISFEGIAGKMGLLQFWGRGSKLPSITLLLQRVPRIQTCNVLRFNT